MDIVPNGPAKSLNTSELDVIGLLMGSSRAIPYRPELRAEVGAVNAVVLLQQMLFRWRFYGDRPFYKFKEPCDHPDYKQGDSWIEETGFSPEEFDTARSKIARKVSASASERPADCLIWYWTDMLRRTFYEVNLPALLSLVHAVYGGWYTGAAGVSYTGNDGIDSLSSSREIKTRENHSVSEQHDKRAAARTNKLKDYISSAEKINNLIVEGWKDRGWCLAAKFNNEDTADALRLLEKDGVPQDEVVRFFEWLNNPNLYKPTGDFDWMFVLSSPKAWRQKNSKGNGNPKIVNGLTSYRKWLVQHDQRGVSNEDRQRQEHVPKKPPIAKARPVGRPDNQ